MKEFNSTPIDNPGETRGENDALRGNHLYPNPLDEREPDNPAQLLVSLEAQPGPEEIIASEATLSAASDKGEILAGLPLEIYGQEDPLNPDRSLAYPNMLYHGTKAENFALDDSRNHRNASVGTGARTGAGMYVASETVSRNFGNGEIVELIPKDMKLINLDAPEASEPLSDEFKDAYITDAKQNAFEKIAVSFPDIEPETMAAIWKGFESTEGFISKSDVHEVALKAKEAAKVRDMNTSKRLVREIASQINIVRMMNELEGTSIRELFATYDSINGISRVASDEVAFDIAPVIDFLTSHGIDGAQTAQRFEGEQAIVLWKLDHVGDKATWERRLKEGPHDIGQEALEGAGVSVSAAEQLVGDVEDEDMLDEPDDIYIESIPFDEAAYKERVGAAKREFLETNSIDLPAANERFEEQAASFIRGIREKAAYEERDLTQEEVSQIKQTAELVSHQRQLASEIAYEKFEARAPEMVQKIRAAAEAEGRDLTTEETDKIKNIVRVISNHRRTKQPA